jgi:hypothetical protein
MPTLAAILAGVYSRLVPIREGNTEMRNNSILRRLGLLVLVLALVAVACGDDDAADDDGTTTTTTAAAGEEFTPGPLGAVTIEPGGAVEIRALQAINGPVAFLGTDQVRGIELAIEDFGDIEGHAVNLGTPEDDGCSAEGGQAGAQAILAQEGVLGVIGTTCSGAAAAASPLLSAAGMVLISGSRSSVRPRLPPFMTATRTPMVSPLRSRMRSKRRVAKWWSTPPSTRATPT